MDPLTALGLASNVFSFVSFASGLVKGTLEISASANGCSADVSKLDTVYEQLTSLCGGLKSCTEHQIVQANDEDHVVQILLAVKSLSEVCKTDGDELLRIIAKLKMKDGSNAKLDSFRVALRKAWEKSRVEDLEKRLTRTEVTLTLHICTLAYYCSRAQSDRVESLQGRSLELQSDQAEALSQITDGLHELQARVTARFKAARTPDQQNVFTTNDVEGLQQRLKSLSLSEKDVTRQQSILGSLTFDSRHVRHTQIATAHEMTFKWALKTNQDRDLDPSIGDWLKEGNGIFWVSGKPGSGKSTLMKFIADSSVASGLINHWARPSRAVIASHYFWIAGTSMQKSQQGLLQTLLYDIFRQCPYLVEQTCAERWASSQPTAPWSMTELRETLHTVATSEDVRLRFFFIIDGMDEYSGDYEDRVQLCRTFKHLAISDNIKLCLSSRPWNIFEEEFGLGYPKLYMQVLTRDDVHSYVTSRLEAHPRWSAISARLSQGQWLISEIAARSNGVFLWVFLVTKLLRESLTNRDGFAELRRRLESFPSELEPFFKAILESVEPFYHSHMSTALQIACTSTESCFNFLLYDFHFQEYEDVDYAVDLPVRAMSEDEIKEIQCNTSWHLDSRTRGLLEVHPDNGTVTFLHRSVRDFLGTREMHDFMVSKIDDNLRFCPSLSILKAHVAMIKTSSAPKQLERTAFSKYVARVLNAREEPHRSMLKLLSDALKHAREFELHTANDVRYRTLIDELDRSLPCLLSGSKCTLTPHCFSDNKQMFFREHLVQFGFFDYLHSKLDLEPDFLADMGSFPVLWFLTANHILGTPLRRGRGTNVLTCLLENGGIDPNKEDELQGISPYSELLEHICHCQNPQRATDILSFLLEEGIFMLFLKCGADPNTNIVRPISTDSGHDARAASVVYLEFCFGTLARSQPIQSLYLEVLREVLRSSNDDTMRTFCNTFCAGLNGIEISRKWDLPFLSMVNEALFHGLRDRGSEITETRQSLNRMATQVFPLCLYTPLDITPSASNQGKRKQETESSDTHRKSRRVT